MKQVQQSGRQMKKKKSAKDTGFGGKPNTLLAIALRIFLWFWFLRFHPAYDKKAIKGIKGPCILLVNHPSSMDAFIIGRGINPMRTNFVASQYFFRFPALRYLLKKIGAIPKSHSQKDIHSLRLMMKSIASGRILVVFPEGRRTMDGTGSRFSEAMAKLAKKTKATVISANITGPYLAWPRWAEKPRPGKVSVSFGIVCKPEDYEQLSVNDVHERMHRSIRFNEFAQNKKDQRHYRCNEPARNMEWLLHFCPSCKKSDAMSGHKDTITCRFCGASAQMTDTGELVQQSEGESVFTDIPTWFKQQREQLAEDMKNSDFCITAEVTKALKAQDPEESMVVMGSGTITLNKENLSFVFHSKNNPENVTFPIRLMDMLPVYLGRYFEICDDDGIYWQFQLAEGRKVIQFEQFADICLYG